MQRLTTLLLAAAVVLTAAACGGGDSATTTAVPTTEDATGEGDVQRQPAGASSFFTISEVGLGPDGYVALVNITDVPVTLAGLFLCQEPDYFELPDVVVGPGETALVTTGDGSGLDGVVVPGATLGALEPSNGEIALYTSRDFDDPSAMIGYLEWGSTPHGRTDEAIEAGLWLEGSFAPTSESATRLYRDEGGLWLFEPNP